MSRRANLWVLRRAVEQSLARLEGMLTAAHCVES